MSTLSTQALVRRASACLLDPEQTAVAEGIASPLAQFLTSLVTADALSEVNLSGTRGAREAATMILDHEHTRITAEPAKEPSSQEALLDSLATSFGHEAVPGVEGDAAEAAYRWLIQLRDDVRQGRVL